MIETSRKKFHKKLKSKAIENARILNAFFELTYGCNFSCRHCYIPSTDIEKTDVQIRSWREESGIAGKDELRTEDVFRILDILELGGCLEITFTGGEPFLREDIFRILEYAARKGFRVRLSTNGSLITAEKAGRLKRLGVEEVAVTFNSPDRDTFDWFVRKKGAYEAVIKSMEDLSRYMGAFSIRSAFLTVNEEDIAEIRHIAIEKLGVPFRRINFITPQWDGSKRNLIYRLQPGRFRKVSKRIERDIESTAKENRTDNKTKKTKYIPPDPPSLYREDIFSCSAGVTNFVINPYGEMRLCMDLPFPKYDLLNGSLNEGVALLRAYRKECIRPEDYICTKCELLPYCSSCPARNYLECGRLNACPPYYKRLAEIAKREIEEKHSYEIAGNNTR